LTLSSEARRRTDRLRAVALEAVLRVCGARQDRYDKAKWHTARGVISVTGAKFMNWSRSFGGGGAIDLAMHLGELDFKGALEWLARHFPHCALSDSPAAPPPELALPPRDDQRLPALRRYLLGERRLPAALLEPLVACGTLYCDTRGNAVFLLLGKEEAPVGAELRGTTSRPWRAMAPGSRKDLGYFSLPVTHPSAIILCESAIDAVSCLALHPGTLSISTAGARHNPLWLSSLTRTATPVYCGFDADHTGDTMARAMIELHPGVRRLRPSRKDWNDELRARR